jgi:tetratricopeptide (TPR) repeat protein
MNASTRYQIAAKVISAGLFLLAALLCPIARGADKDKNKDQKPEKEKKEKVEPWVEIRTDHFIVASDGGEKMARRFADEFESLLRVFQATMPNSRLSTGVPVRIMVAKDGQSFARMAPEFPFDKRHEQPPGMIISSTEKTYIGIRANAGGHFPYADIYQAYARNIVKLSYRNLPPWLEEGYSAVFGNLTLNDRSFRMDRPEPEDLATLFRSPLLPLDLVLHVDRASPYYSPGDKTSVYFAESRIFTHYLIVDPQISATKSLERYIAAVEGGTDSVQAARDAFGDLNQLQTRFAAFVNQTRPLPTDLPSGSVNETGSSPRTLSAAEFQARRADFLSLRGRSDDAQGDLEEALMTEPALAEAEQSLGFLLLKKQNLDDAEKHFDQAVKLDPKDALNFYGQGLVSMANTGITSNPVAAIASLEMAAALNADFAPTWFNLALIYSQRDETLQKALADAQRAASLAPGETSYQLQMASIQNQLGHPEEAAKTAALVKQSATDRATSNRAADLVARAARPQPPAAAPAPASPAPARPVSTATPATPAAPAATAPPAVTAKSEPSAVKSEPAPAPEPARFSETKVYSMIGTITEVNCSNTPQVQLSIKSLTILMKLHAADFAKVSIKSVDSDASASGKTASCSSLRGRTVRISYNLVLDKPWDGEMQELEFRN